MWATFCDDVRQEVGNKLSCMGIYGASLVVPAFPTTLVKLCCIFNVRVPVTSPPRSVVFKLFRDDELIFEADLSAGGTDTLVPGLPPGGPEPQVLMVSSVAQFVSFQVTRRATLRARAYVDGRELKGGGLELQSASTPAAH